LNAALPARSAEKTQIEHGVVSRSAANAPTPTPPLARARINPSIRNSFYIARDRHSSPMLLQNAFFSDFFIGQLFRFA
jgi:hypothetical protein